MLDAQNTIEQQEVAAVFEYVRDNTVGFEKAAERLDEFFDSLNDEDDKIIAD